MTEQHDLMLRMVRKLEETGIPYMVAGSFGSSLQGHPRSTRDVDIVIVPTLEQLQKFLPVLGPDYYVSPEAALDAFHRRAMFNVIELCSGWKVDFILQKDRPFSYEEFARRRQVALENEAIVVVSPEDSILSKLEWDKISPSEQQRRDALGVAQVQGPNLDQDYLRKWAKELDVEQRLEEILQGASLSPPG